MVDKLNSIVGFQPTNLCPPVILTMKVKNIIYSDIGNLHENPKMKLSRVDVQHLEDFIVKNITPDLETNKSNKSKNSRKYLHWREPIASTSVRH